MSQSHAIGLPSSPPAMAVPASPGYWRSVRGRLQRDPVTIGVGLLLLAIVLMTVFAPLVTSYDPTIGSVAGRLQPIGSADHWLGTDETGRDMWARLAYGGRLSLLAGVAPVSISLLIGGVLGITAGYVGGLVGTLIMRLMDVFYAFPSILLAIAICGMLGSGLFNSVLALALVFIPPMVRISETVTSQCRHLDFVEAARASGTTTAQIIRHHMLANVLGPILVYATSLISLSIILSAGLSFLGLGVTPPAAEWGLMLNSLRQSIYVQPYVAALPGLMIFVTSMCFNLAADGLRSAMDVRLATVKPQMVTDPRDRGGPAQPLLIVEELTKYFPVYGGALNRQVATVHAVDGVSFSVRKGETLGIVGESGCGKSTTARLLMRLVAPDRGRLVFDGDEVGSAGGIDVTALRRQMQMVFQDSYSSLNPRMTVIDSVAYAPRMHGLAARDAEARAESLLERVGLHPRQFARRYPHELSGGQRQRVNIARALALEPRLVILDEAVSALDKSVEAQVLNLLADLKEQFDLTYLFISHDLNVVEFISDRVLVMYLGQVVETGPVEAIYARPRHPYTRALLASKPTLDPDRRTTVLPLAGDPPNPIDPPSGCRFRTRCGFARAVCAETAPRLAPPIATVADPAALHLVACHLPDAQQGVHAH